MMKKYQRRHLRAPFREHILYADGNYVHKARPMNISEGGVLLDQIPNFPDGDDIQILISIPQYPNFKNFGLLKLQTFSAELFPRRVVRASGKVVRREELAQSLDNIFRARVGVEFQSISPIDQKYIEEYVTTYSSNLIFLQMLIDSYNTDDETKLKARALAKVLGYSDVEKISELRVLVSHDYKSLQWL